MLIAAPAPLDFMSTSSRTLAGMSTSTPADDPARALISLLDTADALPGAAELRARSYDLLNPSCGTCVVDVGCGTGDLARHSRDVDQ